MNTEPASEAKENPFIEWMQEKLMLIKEITRLKVELESALLKANEFSLNNDKLKAELERERETVLYEASEYFQEFGDKERFTSLQVQQVLMSLIKTNQKIDYGKDR